MAAVNLARTVELGTLPDWIGAIFTGLAFIGFAVALWREARLRRRDERERTAERHDTESAQARLIHVTAIKVDVVDAHVVVSNYSQAPVFHFGVDILSPAVDGEPAMVPYQPDPSVDDALAAGGRADVNHTGITGTTDLALGGTYQVRLRFTDANGLRWERVDNSRPHRLLDSNG